MLQHTKNKVNYLHLHLHIHCPPVLGCWAKPLGVHPAHHIKLFGMCGWATFIDCS